ncbi:MAG: flagellar biosynthetic protein FliP [Phycisphaerae bacterium]|nr:MAG: flagellar biosynthetic protein FliP [Phycisphaerae bacterium]
MIRRLAMALVILGGLAYIEPAFALETGDDTIGIGSLFQFAEGAAQPDRISTTLAMFIMLTVLSLAPALIMMTTSFIRIIVVLGFLRQAMATQQSPPNQVLVGLALFLTFFIMAPTYQRVYDDAFVPYTNEELSMQEAWNAGLAPMREFMLRQTKDRDIAVFMNIAKKPAPRNFDDVPTTVLIPAFVTSELSQAFVIGFVIYIPFLIIDMVVASTLMAMGMMMLPPVFVSLPFKIILFVLADGWYLLVTGLVASFK